MANDLVLVQEHLTALAPRMREIIPAASKLPAERVIQSFLISCEKNPKLYECTPISVQQAVFSACALGLLIDGITGQGYVIPYGGVAQFQIGVKGYVTLAGRSHFMLNGQVIVEGERHAIKLGTAGSVTHEPNFQLRGNGNDSKRVVAAYATLQSNFAPALVDAMGLDEILYIRSRSKGAAKSDSPWNNFFNAMAIKTVAKRLAKWCPLDVLQTAGALDDAGDMGRHAFIRPEDGALIVDHEAQAITKLQPPTEREFTLDPFKFTIADAEGKIHDLGSADNWAKQILGKMLASTDAAQIDAFLNRNREIFDAIEEKFPDVVEDVRVQLMGRIFDLKGHG
jgi:recombination protein RecT